MNGTVFVEKVLLHVQKWQNLKMCTFKALYMVDGGDPEGCWDWKFGFGISVGLLSQTIK